MQIFTNQIAANTPTTRRFFCVFVLGMTSALLFDVTFANGQTVGKQESAKVAKQEIASVLTAQVKSWNDGDLVEFMQTYWKSDQLSFSGGGKTTRGWQATLDNYRMGYAPPKEMGKLHFDHLEITMIESKSALVLGDWHLRMKNDKRKDGNFSLVVKRLKSGWKIIHDHSSTLETSEPDGQSKED